MNTLVVVQVGQSQTAHGGMLYETPPGGRCPSGLSGLHGGEGGYGGLDGSMPSGPGVDIIVGLGGCCSGSGRNVSEAEATGKHSVNADVM